MLFIYKMYTNYSIIKQIINNTYMYNVANFEINVNPSFNY